jgi:DNA repair exonuclease SbcCD ATPase subunit
VFDFEGFSGDDEAHNTRLLVLASLLSNVVIFNTPSIIRNVDIGVLQCAGALSRNLGQDGQRPALLWLLRNFDLSYELNQTGYLNEFIARNEKNHAEIRECFCDLSCIGVPNPNEPIVPGSRTLPLRMQPAEQAIRAEITRQSRGMQQMRGPELVALLRVACAAINTADRDTFDVSTAWQERQKGLARVRRLQREQEIKQICNDFNDYSPAKWNDAITTHFTMADFDDFDDFFTQERARIKVNWAKRTKAVLQSVEGLLTDCKDLPALAQFLHSIVHEYEPKQLIELAVAHLLPQLADKIAALGEHSQSLLSAAEEKTSGVQERLVQLEHNQAEKLLQFRQRLEDLQRSLTAQHVQELALRDEELKQEQAQSANLNHQLRAQGEEFSRTLVELFDLKKQMEEISSSRDQLSEKLVGETQVVTSLKRKIADMEETHAKATKKAREDYNLELKEARTKETSLQDQLQATQEALEDALREKAAGVLRVESLEQSRIALHADNIKLRGEQFRTNVVSTTEATLKAEISSLQKHVRRLQEMQKVNN